MTLPLTLQPKNMARIFINHFHVAYKAQMKNLTFYKFNHGNDKKKGISVYFCVVSISTKNKHPYT